mgnify:FL=1
MNQPRQIRERSRGAAGEKLPADLHPVLSRILLSRGITRAEELVLDMPSLLPPGQLSGIGSAAEKISAAVMQNQRILIVGDFDADGATGTAVAFLSLRAMGCTSLDFRVPNRFEFGYGLSAALVDTLAGDPPDLLITVDSGIRRKNSMVTGSA